MYKSVLIIGGNSDIPEDIRQLYSQEGYFLIGNGKKNISALDLKVLQGNIGPNTRIDICAHGNIRGGQHRIDNILTKDFLANIARYSNGQAMHVHLHSCLAGAASPEVSALPVGSSLVCHSEKKITLVHINLKTILQSNQDLSTTAAVKDFSRRFMLNVKQTATLSIKADEGNIFEHTIRIPNHLLSEPGEIIRYFAEERNKFLDRYNKFIDNNKSMPSLDIIPINTMPELTEEDAIEWKIDNFFYLALTGDEKLSEITKNPENFVDCANSVAPDGLTALMAAAGVDHANTIRALAHIPGIDPNVANTNGVTALMLAANSNYVNAIKALAPFQSLDPNLADTSGTTALICAAEMGHAEAIRELAHIPGIDPNLKQGNGYTALILATIDGHAECVRELAHIPGINPNFADKNGVTALMFAAEMGRAEVIRALAHIPGIDPNVVHEDGLTALIYAANGGHHESIRELAHIPGIDPNLKREDGTTALMLAVINNNTECVRALLLNFKGVDVNMKLPNGKLISSNEEITTMLQSFNSNPIRWLLDNNADVDHLAKSILTTNPTTQELQEILTRAVITGNSLIIEQILNDRSRAIDINFIDKNGRTLLMHAAMIGKADIMEQLRKAGADTTMVDKDGKTAQDYEHKRQKAKEPKKAKLHEEAQAVFPPLESPVRGLSQRQVVIPDAATQLQLAVALFDLSKKVSSALDGFEKRDFGPIEDKETVSTIKEELKRNLNEAKKILKTVSDPLNSACNAKHNEVNNFLYERKSGNEQLEEEDEKIIDEYVAIKTLNDKAFYTQYALETLEATINGLKSNVGTGYLKEMTTTIESLHNASLALQKSSLQYVAQAGTGAYPVEQPRAASPGPTIPQPGLSHQERLAAKSRPGLPPSGLGH